MEEGQSLRTVIVGCGYVGMALAHHWQGYDLTVTTTTGSRLAELEAVGKPFIVDTQDEKKMRELLADADRVVVTVAPKERNYEVYPQTARTICKTMPKRAHLVYTSSTSVYGDCQGEWVNEDSPLKGNPQLVEAEELYQQLPHVTILRLSGIYGPNRELENYGRRIAGSEQVDSFCNWISIDDIVKAIDFVFEENIEGIYNLCVDEHPKRSELYNPMIEKMGLDPISWKEGPTFFGNKRVSNTKIKETGFTFQALQLSQ